MQQHDITRGIGDRVRLGRTRMGMTRKQLAATADVSERYLNELENGSANASIGILIKVADALQQDLLDLVGAARGSEEAAEPVAPATVPVLLHAPLRSLLLAMSVQEQVGAHEVLSDWLEARRRASKGVALLGLRGAGKTTLGRRLAERHGLPFVSVTREIEARAGMSLADLFNLGGPEAYRALENDVVADLVRRDDRIVLETAGGIVGNSEALDAIFGAFKTVWLKTSAEEHLARVAGQGDTRPMRGNPKALEHLRVLLGQREPEYVRAEHVIDTSGRSVEASLAELEAIAAPLLDPSRGSPPGSAHATPPAPAA
jgi:XRE family aerobic/anaerobic benzoate catabolism transcriptional regulator